ncbi:hypothetical protein QJS66_05825 [Kocuria rhizophila]|nr:hypothetical protein QJS66_05825 [Kocuria rhizophila]
MALGLPLGPLAARDQRWADGRALPAYGRGRGRTPPRLCSVFLDDATVSRRHRRKFIR